MENKKKIYHFNFIDVIVILIFVVFIAIIAYFIISPSSESTIGAESTALEYTITVANMNEELEGKVEVGDTITENTGLIKIGTVTNVVYEDSVYTGIDKTTGKNVSQEYPGRVNMTVTISATAVTNTGVYNVGGFTISPGTEISFRTRRFMGNGICSEISEVNS